MNGDIVQRFKPVPKVAAALAAALGIIALAVVAQLAGIDVLEDARAGVALIVAALAPAAAGWLKADE